MKFCKPRLTEYRGANGVVTSYNYVLEQDVEQFHGTEFYNKWREYADKKPYIAQDGEKRIYYADYKECVYKAECWFV